ncbi:hypothetical protein [Allokutzneria multivorans]|uniref:hypothetical protein n=1 Tax=Allokutzneria multivorans TaxID=1142134 RepID=UPI0031E620B3
MSSTVDAGWQFGAIFPLFCKVLPWSQAQGSTDHFFLACFGVCDSALAAAAFAAPDAFGFDSVLPAAEAALLPVWREFLAMAFTSFHRLIGGSEGDSMQALTPSTTPSGHPDGQFPAEQAIRCPNVIVTIGASGRGDPARLAASRVTSASRRTSP